MDVSYWKPTPHLHFRRLGWFVVAWSHGWKSVSHSLPVLDNPASFFLSFFIFLPLWAPPVHQDESLLLFLFHFLSLSLFLSWGHLQEIVLSILPLSISSLLTAVASASSLPLGKKILIFPISLHLFLLRLSINSISLCLCVFFSLDLPLQFFFYSFSNFFSNSVSLLPSYIHISLMPVFHLQSLYQLVDAVHVKTAH